MCQGDVFFLATDDLSQLQLDSYHRDKRCKFLFPDRYLPSATKETLALIANQSAVTRLAAEQTHAVRRYSFVNRGLPMLSPIHAPVSNKACLLSRSFTRESRFPIITVIIIPNSRWLILLPRLYMDSLCVFPSVFLSVCLFLPVSLSVCLYLSLSTPIETLA